MKANRKQIEALLSDFSKISLRNVNNPNEEYLIVKSTQEDAKIFWNEEELKREENGLTPDTPIIRLETKQPDNDPDFYFPLENILNGEIKDSTTLVAVDIEGDNYELSFSQETPITLLEYSEEITFRGKFPGKTSDGKAFQLWTPQIEIICANDSLEATVLQKRTETDEEFATRVKTTLEALALATYERNKHSFPPEPALGQTGFQVYRHRVYWHTHSPKIL